MSNLQENLASVITVSVNESRVTPAVVPRLLLRYNENVSEYASLYVIRSGDSDMLKVGKSTAPSYRVRELQIGNPELLRLERSWTYPIEPFFDLERTVQMALSDHHVRGEWFCCSVEEVEEIVRPFLSDETVRTM